MYLNDYGQVKKFAQQLIELTQHFIGLTCHIPRYHKTFSYDSCHPRYSLRGGFMSLMFFIFFVCQVCFIMYYEIKTENVFVNSRKKIYLQIHFKLHIELDCFNLHVVYNTVLKCKQTCLLVILFFLLKYFLNSRYVWHDVLLF